MTPAEPKKETTTSPNQDFISLQIGPRRVGGRYDHGYAGSAYEVLAIDRGPREQWPTWQITVRYDEDGEVRSHCTGWDSRQDRIVAHPPADVTIVSVGRLHDSAEGEYADILQRATIALDLRAHFRDPHVRADLRQLTAHDQVVRDTVMDTPGVREVLAATALQVQGYLAGPTAAPVTVVTQCAGGRHRAATTAMALRAVVAGDVEQAAAYGLDEAAKPFADRDLVVDLVHRDLDKDVVNR
ncbi:P-loop ATPase [Streptomyces sparsogenes]|uniref:RapZ C-terminal domain-containing protein n=1 Tax=Streptomyces sparsogenes TaxID=67365 RepID=UPI0033EB0CF1